MRIFGYHLHGTPDPNRENEQLKRQLDLLGRKEAPGLQTLRALQDEQYALRSELSAAQRKLASLKSSCAEAEAELQNLRAS